METGREEDRNWEGKGWELGRKGDGNWERRR